MDIHLLGPDQSCTCKARHVCQSCQGQDTKLLAYAEHDCFGCNERGRCEEAEELRRTAIEEARK